MGLTAAALTAQPWRVRGSQEERGNPRPHLQSHWDGEFDPGLPCRWLALARPLTGLPPPPACLPQPVSLDARAYLRVALPIGLLVCLCLLQAFGYRLRRVIAAFYFPKVRPSLTSHPYTCAHTPASSPATPSLGDPSCSALSLSLTPLPGPAREEADPVPLQ